MTTAPFNFECDDATGFGIDPESHAPFGYVTAFDGLGLPAGGLAADLTVSHPLIAYRPPATSIGDLPGTGDRVTVPVVGVIHQLSWGGNHGDPFEIRFVTSGGNAASLRLNYASDTVTELTWWIGNYDPQITNWFAAAVPLPGSSLSGTLEGSGDFPLQIVPSPAPGQLGIDMDLYEVRMRIAPPADTSYALHFASSAVEHVVKTWGLQAGTLPADARPLGAPD